MNVLLTFGIVFVFSIALVLSAFLTFLATKHFPKWGLLDFPERYGLTRARIPYPGGLVIAILSIFLFVFFPEFWFVPAALLVLGVVSFCDDRRGFPAWFRLLVHIYLAAFLFWWGIGISFVGNPFYPGSSIDLTTIPWLSFGLTVLWIVVIQNAMNWFDGIKGLSVGVSGIGFLTLGVFGLVRSEVHWEAHLDEFLLMSFYMAGVCGGAFLLFWRGKILLGDTGSQILGFLLAVLSIFAGTKIATTLLVLGLPIVDSLFVVARRIFWDRKSPFKGDLKHLHHNLSRKIGEANTALVLIFLSGILGAIAIFLTGTVKIIALGISVLCILGLSGWSFRQSS